ncbi:hypothetical protein CSB93_4541 [Pseudomonas paraeruginosa]|uniref:Uncharacterized protein n=1 Tax=Pseudomonas paraeruginosa TaxID=2994495 RepID=A0A2R3IRI2_9PSED|nr:hypothetical protein CSB93_4541 [Pseudomonas paraeruginosa]
MRRGNRGARGDRSGRTLARVGSPYQIRGRTPSKVSFEAFPADV